MVAGQFDDLGGVFGVGEEDECVGGFADDAAGEDLSVAGGDGGGAILVGDDAVGVEDGLGQILGGEAAGGLGEVGAGGPPFPGEAVADDAAGGGEGELTALEVSAAGELGFSAGEDLVEGPGVAGAFGGGEFGGAVGDAGAGGLDGEALGLGGVFEGFLVDVGDEAFEAGAAAPGAGFLEEVEVGATLVEGPAFGEVAEDQGVVELLGVGTVGEHLGDGAAVAGVAGEEILERVVSLGAGLIQEGERFGDDGGGFQVDEQGGQLAVEAVVGGGVERVEPGGDGGGGRLIRGAHADEDEGPGAEEGELGVDIQGGDFDAVERLDELFLKGGISLTGEGDGAGDEGCGVGLGEDAGLPGGDGLVLEGDAGGVADEAVGVVQMGPDEGDGGGGVGGVGLQGFELVAEGAEVVAAGVGGVDGVGGFVAGVGDAVELGLDAAAAGGEVESAIGADGEVGDGERGAGEEFFLGGGVGRASRARGGGRRWCRRSSRR